MPEGAVMFGPSSKEMLATVTQNLRAAEAERDTLRLQVQRLEGERDEARTKLGEVDYERSTAVFERDEARAELAEIREQLSGILSAPTVDAADDVLADEAGSEDEGDVTPPEDHTAVSWTNSYAAHANGGGSAA